MNVKRKKLSGLGKHRVYILLEQNTLLVSIRHKRHNAGSAKNAEGD